MLKNTTTEILFSYENHYDGFIASMCKDTFRIRSLRKELAMATLKKRRGNWYARVQWYKANQSVQSEKQVPLRTKSKVTARERLAEVNKVENDIKEGLVFKFPWLSNLTKTKMQRFTLKDAINSWIFKRLNKVSKNTTSLNNQGLNYFMSFIGKTYPLNSINSNHIEKFIIYLESLRLSSTSINMHLRTIKAMFRYYKRIEKLEKIPFIQQLSIPKKEPIYITDSEFHSILKLDWLDTFYKRIFILYRETGMRLREPMISVLDGNWIDIPNTSKSKVGRNIELNNELNQMYLELNDWLEKGYGSRLKDSGEHISKKFKKALIDIGAHESKHFHSLRHTYAVRMLLKGTSIYKLKLLMGHSSVTTTEVYSNMNLRRVRQDFPKLCIAESKDVKFGKKDTLLKDTKLPYSGYML